MKNFHCFMVLAQYLSFHYRSEIYFHLYNCNYKYLKKILIKLQNIVLQQVARKFQSTAAAVEKYTEGKKV